MRKFLVFAPSYDENVGGNIVQHKLAHILLELGYEAYIYPNFHNYEVSIKNFKSVARALWRDYLNFIKPFALNPYFKAPVYKGGDKVFLSDEWIVVCPELMFGNPLGAKNVVRWILHHPGKNSGKIYYGFNEFQTCYFDSYKPFLFPGSVCSENLLRIVHFPLELYNQKDVDPNRQGTAYCIRKGKNKVNWEDLGPNPIIIDGKSHAEIASIFKRVKTFVSYDAYTAYSRFATLCGCDSIVIPDPGVGEEQWYGDARERMGVAYGFENIEKARETAPLLLERIQAEHHESFDNVEKFAKEADLFFDQLNTSTALR